MSDYPVGTVAIATRIQRRRTKGWRLPAGAVYVGRGTRYGNPFKVVPVHPSGPYDVWHGDTLYGRHTNLQDARKQAADLHRDHLAPLGLCELEPDAVEALRGKTLACWCPPDQPCHADNLIDLANQPDPKGAP